MRAVVLAVVSGDVGDDGVSGGGEGGGGRVCVYVSAYAAVLQLSATNRRGRRGGQMLIEM